MTTSCLKLLLPLAFLLFLHGSFADVYYVYHTCQKTYLPPFCMSTLETDNRSNTVASIRELASIAIGITITSANDTLNYVTELNNKTEMEKPEYGPLIQCKSLYNECVRILANAKAEVDAKHDAIDLAGTFHTFPESCERGFMKKLLPSPLTQVNKEMKDKCRVASDLIDMLG